MTKYRALGLTALLAAFPVAIIPFEFVLAQWTIIFYPFMVGICFSLIQRETKSYRFIPGILFGPVLLGGISFLVAGLRATLMWPVMHGASLSQYWSMAPLFGIIIGLSFFGCLFGIVLKGCYSLYPKWSERSLLFVGPVLLMAASLFVAEARTGGTVSSVLRGWPFLFFVHLKRDVLDQTVINRWVLESSAWHWHIVAGYLFYIALLFGASYCAMQMDVLRRFGEARRSMAMISVLMIGIVTLSSMPVVQHQAVWRKIARSQSCVLDEDCMVLSGHTAFSCAIAVNKDRALEVQRLLDKVPAPEDTVICLPAMTAVCAVNKCESVPGVVEDR